MRKQFAVALVVLSLLSSNAWALTLNEARTQGRVGETLNGYLVALQTDAETQALVSEINKARNASYQQLAESNNIPPDEVAKMAGQKLVARAKPGEYVQGINGKWLRKELISLYTTPGHDADLFIDIAIVATRHKMDADIVQHRSRCGVKSCGFSSGMSGIVGYSNC